MFGSRDESKAFRGDKSQEAKQTNKQTSPQHTGGKISAERPEHKVVGSNVKLSGNVVISLRWLKEQLSSASISALSVRQAQNTSN